MKVFSTNDVRTAGYPYKNKKRTLTSLSYYSKVNSYIRDLNAKSNTMKLVEESISVILGQAKIFI